MNLVFRGLLLLALLFVLALAFVFLPAHWQVREARDPLPEAAALLAALDVPGAPVAAGFINTSSQLSPAGLMGHPGIVLRWPDGRVFVVDTGMPPAEAEEFGRALEFALGAEPARNHGGLAQQLGEDVDNVAGIGFTHLHSDHTAGLPEICGAQARPAIVYQTGRQFAEHNHTTRMGLKYLDLATCERIALPPGVIKSISGFPGLAVVALGGHTPGSTLFAVRVDGHNWLFSGDITNSRAELLDDLPKHWVYSTFIVPEDTLRSARLRAWLRALDERQDTTVLPAHDLAAMAHYLPASAKRATETASPSDVTGAETP